MCLDESEIGMFREKKENLNLKILERIYGTKYSRMDQVKFVEDSL